MIRVLVWIPLSHVSLQADQELHIPSTIISPELINLSDLHFCNGCVVDYTYLESSLSISLKIMNIFIFNDFWVFVLCSRTKTQGKARLLSLQFSGTAV